LFMGIPTYGADSMLRFQIRHKLRQIQADDRKIWWEGIRALSPEDLEEVNHDRGMPYQGRTRERLESQLARWLDLSMNNAVPPSLLILSRTFVITTTDNDTTENGDALRAAIKSIEKEVVEEIQEELEEDVLESVEKKKKKTEEKTKADEAAEDLEELKREVELINEEKKAMQDIETQEKQREEELQTMHTELQQMMTHVTEYNERMLQITQATKEIAEAHRQAVEAFVINEKVVDEDVVEVERSEHKRLQEKVAQVEEFAEGVSKTLLKTEVAMGKAAKKVRVAKMGDGHDGQ